MGVMTWVKYRSGTRLALGLCGCHWYMYVYIHVDFIRLVQIRWARQITRLFRYILHYIYTIIAESFVLWRFGMGHLASLKPT
jgi:hypothetical protein